MADELGQRADEEIAALRAQRHPRLFVISGPSGVGKDTVIDRLREMFPDCYFAVTATTRPRRPGEMDGVHYFFLDDETFADRLAEGEFLESAEVYGVGHYGVLKEPIRQALAYGQDVIVKVDVQGAATIRGLVPHATLIFLAPESMEELLHRLRSRKTDEPEALMRRFSTASKELSSATEFDYLVFNGNERMDVAIERISAIVTAERCRVTQPPVEL